MNFATRRRAVAAVALMGFANWVSAQILEISGSTTVHKRIVEPHTAAIRTATGVELKMFPVGSGKGMIDLVEGKVGVAAISETMEEAIASAQKSAKADGKSFSAPADLRFHELVADRVVVVVNRDNGVGKITVEQAKDIHTGKIRNWKEVGGPDLPIRVITGAPGSATRAVFQAKVMGGAEYGADTQQLRATIDEVRAIGLNKGAVGVLSDSVAKGAADKLKIVDGVSVSRPLAFVTNGLPKADLQKVVSFLKSREGQKLLAQ